MNVCRNYYSNCILLIQSQFIIYNYMSLCFDKDGCYLCDDKYWMKYIAFSDAEECEKVSDEIIIKHEMTRYCAQVL